MKRMISVVLAAAVFMALTILSGCSIKLARDADKPSTEPLLSKEKYQFSDAMTFEEALAAIKSEGISSCTLTDESATYRIVNINIEMDRHSDEYVPQLRLCCQTSETDQQWEVTNIAGASMVTDYEGVNKPYAGEIFVNIESPSRVYYSVNGFFYDLGTPSAAEETDTKAEKGLKLLCNTPNAFNFYDSTSEYGTVEW